VGGRGVRVGVGVLVGVLVAVGVLVGVPVAVGVQVGGSWGVSTVPPTVHQQMELA